MSISSNKIIAWNIVYEIMQRSTESLSLMTLHPGGGQYNCLGILRSFDEEPQMLINLNGTSIHVGKDNDLIHSYPELYKQNNEYAGLAANGMEIRMYLDYIKNHKFLSRLLIRGIIC